MQNIEGFAFQITFGDILYNLRSKKTPLDPISVLYIQDAEQFLEQLLRTLAGMDTNAYQEDAESAIEAFQFVPNLRDVIDLPVDTRTTFDQKKLNSLKEYFSRLKAHLLLLRSNPEGFYKEKASEELLRFIERVSMIYSENYQVLSHSKSMLQFVES